ncbi:unnamed protein product [Nezara viridula]|uniref:Cystatin domain-containing protein n=1 Tax=Nezara viridula TaxID=85310 RepID=A0A9P0HSA7_NEZVI|nr:unnamed protein product [Nezara viridula]
MFTKAFILLFVGVCFANGQLAGGKFEVDPNDQEIRSLLQKALSSKNSNASSEPQRIVRVISAEGQVVSGNIYTIRYVSEGIDSGIQIQCQIKLHSQPWVSDTPKVVSNQCVPVETPRFY